MPSQQTSQDRPPVSHKRSNSKSEQNSSSQSASNISRDLAESSSTQGTESGRAANTAIRRESTKPREESQSKSQVEDSERETTSTADGSKDTDNRSFLGRTYNPSASQEQPAHLGLEELAQPSRQHSLQNRLPFPDRSKVLHYQDRQSSKDESTNQGAALPTPRTSKSSKNIVVPGYHAWKGTHTEDQLSEQVVKNGYFDKQLVLNEGNTARSSLWPHFKNKSGLHALSAFFVALQHKKQDHGHVTAPSTFRPPPRVTLTDAKREAWLRDLADDSVPLRRLSRTIPHGIRGKALLEQCLAKQVPIPRGVWLARCVGANEMRAFRRKGVSGATTQENEVRWIKEWTSSVIQFIEESVDKSSHGNGRTAVQYILRMATRFYAENLLDRTEFLSWLLDCLENCSIEKLPLFLLLTRIYWSQLIQSFQYAEKLSKCCVKRFSELPDNDIFERLRILLVQNIRTLACVVPRSISTHCDQPELRTVLAKVAQQSDPRVQAVLRHLILRNNRLECAANRRFKPKPPVRLSLVDLLNEQRLSISLNELLSQCITILDDHQELITALLNWASSVHTGSIGKAYTAARIIHLLRESGDDTDAAILSSLSTLRSLSNSQPRLISAVLNELTQDYKFDLGRYMRWLIATGALYSNRTDQKYSWDVEILRNLSFHDAPAQSLNLRNTLLRRSGAFSKEESKLNAEVRQMIERTCLPVCFANSTEKSSSEAWICPDLEQMTVPAQEELGRGILESIGQEVELGTRRNGSTDHADMSFSKVNLLRICTLLIKIQSYTCLKELLLMVSSKCDLDILFAVSQVFEVECDVFLSAGTAGNLLRVILTRYRSLRASTSPSKECVELLLRITKHISPDASALTYLNHEIFLCNQGLGVAAFTPESESDLDVSNKSLFNSNDELDYLLSRTGTHMDHQNFEEIFQIIAQKMVSLTPIAESSRSVLQVLLRRLNGFDSEKLHQLIAEWIKQQLDSEDAYTLIRVVPTLVDCGCLELAYFIQNARDHISGIFDENPSRGAVLALPILHFLLSDENIIHPDAMETDNVVVSSAVQNLFHFAAERQRLLVESPGPIIQLLYCSLHMPEEEIESSHIGSTLQPLLQNGALLDVLQACEKMNPSLIASELEFASLPTKPSLMLRLRILINFLVDPLGEKGFPNLSEEDAIKVIFSTADSSSFPLYRVALQFFAATLSSHTDSDTGCSIVSLMAAKAGLLTNNAYWSELVHSLDASKLSEICKYAQTKLLSKHSSTAQELSADSDANVISSLKRFMNVINTTMGSLSVDKHSDIVQEIILRLTNLTQFTTSPERKVIAEADVEYEYLNSMSFDVLQHWIQALLHVTMIHSEELLLNTGDSSACNKVLSCLCNIIVHGYAKLSADTSEYVLDLIGYFSTNLSDQMRTTVQSALGSLGHDQRVAFLLGHSLQPEDSLRLISRSFSTDQPTSAQPSQTPQSSIPFPFRPWELLPDSTPNVGANVSDVNLLMLQSEPCDHITDTALNMKLFDARVG